MRGLTVGSVLNKTFSVWAKNILPFSVLSGLIYLPVFIVAFVMMSSDNPASVMWLLAAIGLISLILSFIVTGTIVYGSVQQLRGLHAPLIKSVSVGLSRLLAVLGTALLVLLCLFGCLLPAILAGIAGSGGGALFLGIVGVIAALVVSLSLWVAIPVAVIENIGGMAALRRSRELTADYRGTLFGVMFIIGIIQNVVSRILETVTEPSLSSLAPYVIGTLFVAMAFAALQGVSQAVAYYELRQTKDGVSVDELAQVFE